MFKELWGRFLCFIGDHEWTGKALEGEAPDDKIKALAKLDPLAGFKEYSTMYCKRPHCKKISDLSL